MRNKLQMRTEYVKLYYVFYIQLESHTDRIPYSVRAGQFYVHRMLQISSNLL